MGWWYQLYIKYNYKYYCFRNTYYLGQLITILACLCSRPSLTCQSTLQLVIFFDSVKCNDWPDRLLKLLKGDVFFWGRDVKTSKSRSIRSPSTLNSCRHSFVLCCRSSFRSARVTLVSKKVFKDFLNGTWRKVLRSAEMFFLCVFFTRWRLKLRMSEQVAKNRHILITGDEWVNLGGG